MTADQHSRLRAILRRLDAEDLAMEVAAVEDVRARTRSGFAADLDEKMRGAIIRRSRART